MATKTEETTNDQTIVIEDDVTRRINKKKLARVRAKNNPSTTYPVEAVVHKQDGVEVTYTMKNGKNKTEFIEVGNFGRLIHYIID